MKRGVQLHSNPKYKCTSFGSTKISLSKPINTKSTFENLDARSLKVETIRNLEKQLSWYFVLNLRFKNIRGKTIVSSLPCTFSSHFFLLTILGEHVDTQHGTVWSWMWHLASRERTTLTKFLFDRNTCIPLRHNEVVVHKTGYCSGSLIARELGLSPTHPYP